MTYGEDGVVLPRVRWYNVGKDDKGFAEMAFNKIKKIPTAEEIKQELPLSRGLVLLKQRRDEDAVELLDRCLQLAPDHTGAHADLGKALLHLRQYRAAVKHLQQATSIDTYGDIHYQLGQALRNTGDVVGSQRAFARSKEIRSKQVERERRLRLQRD